MKYINILFTLFCLFGQGITFAQKAPELKGLFRSPLDIQLYLSGNFGELRSNHFHTGIDIKTEGVVGKAVYAVDDGYVSRIKISLFGYGKVIYITHPNGFTTVYAHLSKGNEIIEAYLKQKQYQKESYEIELFPAKADLPVKKGELIARSGNSGSSGGPHLHFEIRETATEKPMNPLLFGFAITDNISPIIRGVKLYPLSNNAVIIPVKNPKGFLVSGAYGKYHLATGQEISVYGDVGFAIDTYDLLNGYPNKCGIYQISLSIDSQLVFEQDFEKLNFSTLRYINTYTDYPLFKKYRSYYHKQFIGENNRLRIYPVKQNNGVFSFADGKKHKIKYTVIDSYGNKSELSFQVNSLLERPEVPQKEKTKPLAFFTVDGPDFFMDGNLTIDVPPLALYENMSFNYKELPGVKNGIGKVYQIGNEWIPLQKNISITFNNPSIPENLENKALVVMVDDNNRFSNMGGKMKNGKMVLKTRNFGKFTLALDTIVPRIKPVNIFQNKDMSTYNTFSVKISDDLSGVDSYRGTIDGKWILMEYEPKQNKLTYRFDKERVKPGKHQFYLEVIDGKGNKNTFKADFIR